MSDVMHDAAFAMPGLSMRCLEGLGETVLGMFQPTALAVPEAVDVLGWIDRILPRFGVHVTPAGDEELGDCAALTYPSDEFGCEILIREWMWNDLAGDPHPVFARATVIHELAHAILHVPIVRKLPNGDVSDSHSGRTSVPVYCDPEWQAWALAGSILMPRRTLAMLSPLQPSAIATAYQVSEQFATAHLKRLRIDARS